MPLELERPVRGFTEFNVLTPDRRRGSIIKILPPLDLSPVRLLRKQTMSDPEAAVAEPPPVKEGLKPGDLLKPIEHEQSRQRIIDEVIKLTFSPSENVSTVATIKMMELDASTGRKLAKSRGTEAGDRLRDRFAQQTPQTDEIELLMLVRLFKQGLREGEKAEPHVREAIRMSETVQSLAEGRLRNPIALEIVFEEEFQPGGGNWWNRLQLIWNAAKNTESPAQVLAKINPDFFRVTGMKFKHIVLGKLLSKLSPSSPRKGLVIPGMAEVQRPEDIFLDGGHAQAKIAATFSLVSLKEYHKLGVDDNMIEKWQQTITEYSKRNDILGNTEKLLMLADFQVAVDQVMMTRQARIEQDRKIAKMLKDSREYKL